MNFAGWQRSSLIDFPGKISTILFTQGCPFRCHFCHNPGLVLPAQFEKTSIHEDEVCSFLERRKGKLDGIVISGGEPTIHPKLIDFIQRVRAMGFAIKVDTNGILPDVIKTLLPLVDYWAMDLKAPIENYEKVVGVSIDPSTITQSIHLLMKGPSRYEFRTTVVPSLHSPEDIEKMAQQIAGAERYVLQQFRPMVTLDPLLQQAKAYSDDEMEKLCQMALPHVKECTWR
jgi:pyruvate formate lyase activating enzyme